MPWTNQGGGAGGGGGPWGRGPGGPGQPDLEEMLRRGQARFRTILPGGVGGVRAIILVAIIAFGLWGASGFYRVQPEQLGVELVFGRLTSVTTPGLNYNWPSPVGEVMVPRVERVNRVEVGFVSGGEFGRTDVIRDIPQEGLMLTGDENIIDVQVVVFWKIDTRTGTVQTGAGDEAKAVTIKEGVRNFLFNIRNPEQTVKDAAEAALREIIGKNQFEFARTQGRVQIETEAQTLIQSILDDYGAGVEVRRVQLQKIDPPGNVLDAFRDVQAAAADKERAINEATAYFNEVVQRALGEGERIKNAAEGYRQEKIAIATGEANRFLAVYKEYLEEKSVTKRRIYLDVMKDVMRDIDKILIDNRLGGTGVVPYLPLNELTRPRGAGAKTGAK